MKDQQGVVLALAFYRQVKSMLLLLILFPLILPLLLLLLLLLLPLRLLFPVS